MLFLFILERSVFLTKLIFNKNGKNIYESTVVILCFALMCNSLQREQTESNSLYLIFCLAH